MAYKGKVHTVGDNIDTDAIIPARFLVTTDEKELGANCMEGLEEGWIKRVSDGDVMVAGPNFGCGSSREHAPIALKGAGIPVVVAHSFARIFYRNGFNMGLILMEVGDDYSKFRDGDEIEADPEAGIVRNVTTGEEVSCAPVPPSMQELLDAGGLVGFVKQRLGA